MTPKEKIYAKIIDTKNEERRILGLVAIDKDKSLADGFARNHSIKELQEDLDIAQRSLAATKKKAEITAYFKTPAGIELKKRLEKKIDEAKATLLKAHADMAIDLRDFTMSYLGHRWLIRNFNDHCLSIDFNDMDGKAIFGMRIEVFYSIDFNDEDAFRMSYSSSGDFDPTSDADRHEFLTGLFTITKKDVALELKKMLKAFARFYGQYKDEIYNLNDQLQNPPING